MNIGILGGGNISATHARAAAAAGCQVVAVWGANAGKARDIASEHGAAGYDDLEQFLDHRPLDLVAIGSPSGLHGEHASQAARRGLHVLVEKPLEISTARVDALLTEAKQAGVKLGVFFQDRLKPDLVRVKGFLDEDGVGRVVLASAQVKWYREPKYYAASRWRGTWALDGGGALMNQGIHTVDALLWLLGPVTSVTAMSGTMLHGIEVEDTVVATLRFTSGALATLEAATSAYPGYPRRIEITGTEGTVIVEGDDLTAADLRGEEKARLKPSAKAPSTESQSSPVVSDVSAHRRIIEDFVEAIRTGREPACSGAEGRRSVALVEAIYEAARTGNSIQVK